MPERLSPIPPEAYDPKSYEGLEETIREVSGPIVDQASFIGKPKMIKVTLDGNTKEFTIFDLPASKQVKDIT